MDKSIAIIIPNYNKSKYLKECLDSAVNQTYQNKEIIFVDDCSTDNSLEIAYEYEKNYKFFKVIALKQNAGVSNARNIGVENCNSDYIVFLDSDDVYVNKDKLLNEMQIVDTYKIAFSQHVTLAENGTQLPLIPVEKNLYASKYAIVDLLLITRKNHEQLRGYVISKNLFNEINGYDTSLNIYEDLDLQSRLALKARFVYTYDIGEGYRRNTGGLSFVKQQQATTTIKAIRKKYFKKLSLWGKIVYLFKKVTFFVKTKFKNLIIKLKRKIKPNKTK